MEYSATKKSHRFRIPSTGRGGCDINGSRFIFKLDAAVAFNGYRAYGSFAFNRVYFDKTDSGDSMATAHPWNMEEKMRK